ncbi:unnamed protein product [Closterium sp. Naga37s-1]|nr:unnamed protein product [Closterium sp. Naga37s-1]
MDQGGGLNPSLAVTVTSRCIISEEGAYPISTSPSSNPPGRVLTLVNLNFQRAAGGVFFNVQTAINARKCGFVMTMAPSGGMLREQEGRSGESACGECESVSGECESMFGACEIVSGARESVCGACGACEGACVACEGACGANEGACGACEGACGACEGAYGACEGACGACEGACGACEGACGACEGVCDACEGACGASTPSQDYISLPYFPRCTLHSSTPHSINTLSSTLDPP